MSGSDSYNSKLIEAIRSRYPDLTEQGYTDVAKIIIEEVASRLAKGDDLAFVHHNVEGQMEIITLALEKMRNS